MEKGRRESDETIGTTKEKRDAIAAEEAAIDAALRSISREIENTEAEIRESKQSSRMVLDSGRTRVAKTPASLSSAADVTIAEPEWLIPGYVPRYGITTLGGEGGTGKTSIICNIAAAVTTGRQPFFLEDQIPFARETRKSIIFFCGRLLEICFRPKIVQQWC